MGCEVKIEVKFAIWLKIYLWACFTHASFTSSEPNWVKLDKIVRKGITVKLVPASEGG